MARVVCYFGRPPTGLDLRVLKRDGGWLKPSWSLGWRMAVASFFRGLAQLELMVADDGALVLVNLRPVALDRFLFSIWLGDFLHSRAHDIFGVRTVTGQASRVQVKWIGVESQAHGMTKLVGDGEVGQVGCLHCTNECSEAAVGDSISGDGVGVP